MNLLDKQSLLNYEITHTLTHSQTTSAIAKPNKKQNQSEEWKTIEIKSNEMKKWKNT